jgi:hypothetical protein
MDESRDFHLKILGILQCRRGTTNIFAQDFLYFACEDEKFGNAGGDGRSIHPIELECGNRECS